MDDTRGFEADGEGFKKLVWDGGQPSAILTSGQAISMAALHHQGRAKEKFVNNYSAISEKVCFAANFYCQLVLLSYKIFQRYGIVLNPSKAPRFLN
jgi:hypothetical protein